MVLLLPRLGLAVDPPDPLSVLFVADGWYQQEDDIETHLLDLGHDVTVKTACARSTTARSRSARWRC
ncbi:MAG: hypothetical protein R6V85_05600, partial [Polyangia bacterium]